jgi:hypothetical protein
LGKDLPSFSLDKTARELERRFEGIVKLISKEWEKLQMSKRAKLRKYAHAILRKKEPHSGSL